MYNQWVSSYKNTIFLRSAWRNCPYLFLMVTSQEFVGIYHLNKVERYTLALAFPETWNKLHVFFKWMVIKSTEFIKTVFHRIPGPWTSRTWKIKKHYLHIFSPLVIKHFERRCSRRKQAAQSSQETRVGVRASRKGNEGEVKVEFREQFRTGVLCQVNNRGNVKE